MANCTEDVYLPSAQTLTSSPFAAADPVDPWAVALASVPAAAHLLLWALWEIGANRTARRRWVVVGSAIVSGLASLALAYLLFVGLGVLECALAERTDGFLAQTRVLVTTGCGLATGGVAAFVRPYAPRLAAGLLLSVGTFLAAWLWLLRSGAVASVVDEPAAQLGGATVLSAQILCYVTSTAALLRTTPRVRTAPAATSWPGAPVTRRGTTPVTDVDPVDVRRAPRPVSRRPPAPPVFCGF